MSAIASRVVRLAGVSGPGEWERDGPLGLTPREASVVDALAAGATDRQIARRLGIGQPTVKVHLTSARRKLGARRRTDLVRLYCERRQAAGMPNGQVRAAIAAAGAAQINYLVLPRALFAALRMAA